ncbi:hypothetical protein QQG55_31885 [Brugia pahangi]
MGSVLAKMNQASSRENEEPMKRCLKIEFSDTYKVIWNWKFSIKFFSCIKLLLAVHLQQWTLNRWDQIPIDFCAGTISA